MKNAGLKSLAIATVDALRMADSGLRGRRRRLEPQRLRQCLRTPSMVKLALHLLPRYLTQAPRQLGVVEHASNGGGESLRVLRGHHERVDSGVDELPHAAYVGHDGGGLQGH